MKRLKMTVKQLKDCINEIPRKFDGKKGYVITVKSGAEVNMSEELYQHLVKYFERSNEYLKRF